MNVPKLRFKGFEDAWEVHKFSEKFTFHNTNSYSRALLAEQGSVMNIHYGDIHTKFSTLFDVAKENVPFLSSEVDTQKIATNQFLQVKDLIIADASEDYKDIGKTIEVVNLHNQKVVAGLHTYIARPNLPSASGFNGYLMQTFKVREQIQKLATGISVLGISKGNLGSIELNTPCLSEQTKIASFLSAVDDKMACLVKEHELWQQYKQGMMQQLFSQTLRFQDDDGQDFPEWECDLIKNVFTNKSKIYNPTSSPEMPCVELEHLTQNTGKIINTISSIEQKSNKNLFNPSEVLFGKLRPYLRKFAQPNFKGVCSSEIWVLRGLKISNNFLFQYVQGEEFAELINIQSGSKMPRADWNIIANSEISYPCLEEQTKIAACLSAIDDKINSVAQQLEQARLWKQGLLQQMFV